MSAARAAATAVGVLAGAGAAAAVWGIGVERHLYAIRRGTLKVLPAGSRPIRVLHLADAHLAPWQTGRQQWISRLASLRPDLIVNTGDNLGHPDALIAARRAFSSFAGIPGVFVHGSNDYWGPSPRNPLRYLTGPSKRPPVAARLDTDALDAFFADELGWTPLDNTHTVLEARGTRVGFIGLGDAHHGLADAGSLPASAAALPEGLPRLGVTHAPYRWVLDALVDSGVDALLAGHTHGGQVRVPGIGALVSNCDLPVGQARGLSEWTHAGRTVPLQVSAGLGHSIYAPVRFACRPEVTLLTLTARG